MELVRASDVAEFARLAGAFLAEREAEHNLLLGIVASLRGPTPRQPPYLAVVTDRDRVVAAAIRTPPVPNVVLSGIADDRAIPLLVDDLRSEAPDLGGLLGEKRPARLFAERWQERTGRAVRVQVAERIFRLTRVIPPRPVSGRLRAAEPRDRDRLALWLAAFALEALGPDQDTSLAGEMADRWIAGLGRTMYLWDDGGVVSLCGVSGETPHGIRIAPVYTPPELRGRGYASACVAAASQAQLDAGRRYCFLFTDLANPTSNKIYEAIGYEPVCDVDQYRFTAVS